MKRKIRILNYPKQFNFEYITALHPIVEEELKKIIERSGRKKAIVKQLERRLNYLEKNKDKSILHREWFESYTGIGWLHALILKDTDLNIRMYFSFIENRAVFLHAYIKKGNADMAIAKKIAKERYDEIREKQ